MVFGFDVLTGGAVKVFPLLSFLKRTGFPRSANCNRTHVHFSERNGQ